MFVYDNDHIFHIVNQMKISRVQFVNWTLPALHGEKLEITLTVLLNTIVLSFDFKLENRK